MKFSTAVVLAAFSVSTKLTGHRVEAKSSVEDKFCCLCKDCKPVLNNRWDLFLNDKGLSCSKLDRLMINPGNDSKPGNAICNDLKYNHRQACCDATYPAPKSIPQAPTPAPTYSDDFTMGNNDVCNLCRNGNKPGKPFTLVFSNQSPAGPHTATCAPCSDPPAISASDDPASKRRPADDSKSSRSIRPSSWASRSRPIATASSAERTQ